MVNEELWNVYYLRFVVIVGVDIELLVSILLNCVMFCVSLVVIFIWDC